jgi:hypothetical protein
MKIFNNIDWEWVRWRVFSPAGAIILVMVILPALCVIAFWEYSGRYGHDAYDYVGISILPVLYIWVFAHGIICDEKFKKRGKVKRISDESGGKIEISVERFKTMVEALEALPEGIRGYSADMRSMSKPTCGTAGGFSGLICIVVNDIPELRKSHSWDVGYAFDTWEVSLYNFLECDFSKWAEYNPKFWGNSYGGHMFNSSKAFGKNHGDTLTHDEMIIHLKGVCNRLEQSKKGEMK